jgi:3-deoxy-D-manno-octulosonic-acid transferase
MIYGLYSTALAFAALVSSPWWLFKMARHGKYRAGIRERLGQVPARLETPPTAGCIWVHAVSVGEVLACSAIIAGLHERFPERRVVISTTTASGQALAHQRFGAKNVFYFPLDFAFAIRPWLRVLRPQLVILAETEFWPNFLRLARHSGAKVVVVNARISDRSLPRYRRFRFAMRRILRNVDLLLAQTEEDRCRLISMGAQPERALVTGNLKFEIAPPAASPLAQQLRLHLQTAGSAPVVVFGSTVEGEEALLLPAFRAVLERFPKAVLVLAPRHPERFRAVADLLRESGLRLCRRSLWDGYLPLAGGVFLLDSIGELASLYPLAAVAFVGGSLAPHGGHNILEPAQAGAAVLTGPHTENFRDIVRIFRQAQAVRIASAREIASVLLEMLTDEPLRGDMTRRARDILLSQSGATARTLDAIQMLLTRDSLLICESRENSDSWDGALPVPPERAGFDCDSGTGIDFVSESPKQKLKEK